MGRIRFMNLVHTLQSSKYLFYIPLYLHVCVSPFPRICLYFFPFRRHPILSLASWVSKIFLCRNILNSISFLAGTTAYLEQSTPFPRDGKLVIVHLVLCFCLLFVIPIYVLVYYAICCQISVTNTCL